MAEDNETNLAVVLDMLAARDHQVVVAKNGQTAIEMAQSFKPDLILMDIKMPVLNGLEATKKLRAMPDFAETPILALTASADILSEQAQLDAGCTEHLSKPIRAKELYAALERHLN